MSVPPSSDATPASHEQTVPALPDARVWLVDGFNAIHTVLLGGQSRDEWWTEPVRARLLERIHRFERPAAEIWVVFDGPRPAQPHASADESSAAGGEPSAAGGEPSAADQEPSAAGREPSAAGRRPDAKAEAPGAPLAWNRGEGEEPGPLVHVVFAPSADDWLVEQARRAEQPEALAVVTADRKVAGRCRHAAASVVSPRAFLACCPGGDQPTG